MSTQEEQEHQLSLTQRALLAVKDLRERLRVIEQAKREPIAITGIGCRFPGGVDDRHAFWRLLRDGGDATGDMPAARWAVEDYYDPDPQVPGKTYTRRGAFLSQVDGFDAHFFGVAPREALKMDPQQRLLLEVTWEALEDAGIPPGQLKGTLTGVFIGIMHNDYARIEQAESDLASIDAYTGTGRFFSVASGRISHILGLNGPSIAVDTACSASLVSVHLACQSLRAGECEIALAGGVNLLLRPEPFIESSKLHSLSPDGRCKTFDASADGYVRGEGCGMIVLKRLSAALRDHDPILAVIRASAVTHNGASGGLTVPNGVAQQLMLRQALNSAGINPVDVSYVEAHGTGTALGDPIEMQALGTVFGQGREIGRPLLVGSVKTNIGHLEAAAGIAGLIKVVMSLQHGEIPANLHLRQVNSRIPLQALKLQVPTELQRWEVPAQHLRLAGVNSSGISGTNAHLVIEETPHVPEEASVAVPAETVDGLRTLILPLSARDPQALRALAQAYLDRLALASWADLQDICYTASRRRMHHELRLALVGSSAEDLRGQLKKFLERQPKTQWLQGQGRAGQQERVVFVFPGQGAQWIGMGRLLMQQEPVFLEALQRCEQAMRSYIDWSLIEELNSSEEHSRLAQIDVVQPVLFAIQVALAALWRSYGVEPDAVVGHSMGEVAAAHVAGILDLNDAARIICIRSRLLRRLSGQGAMAVVALSFVATQELVSSYSERLAIAASNSPYSTVIAGDAAALREIHESLQERNIACTFVKVDVASHSPQVDIVLNELHQELVPIHPRLAEHLMYSTVTGLPVQGTELNAEYWERNLREPVLFGDAVQRMITEGYQTYIELSPHPLLTVAVEECLDMGQVEGRALPSMKREQESTHVLSDSLGICYTCGLSLNWRGIIRSGHHASLPAYPWQRQRYWMDVTGKRAVDRLAGQGSIATGPEQPFPGTRIRTPLSHIQYEICLDPDRFSFLKDHCLSPDALLAPMVVSGSAYLSLVLSALREALHTRQCLLEDIHFIETLVIPEQESRILHLLLTPQAAGRYRVEIFSLQAEASRDRGAADWTLHATGTAVIDAFVPRILFDETARSVVRERCQRIQNGGAFYEELRQMGYHFGRQYQWYEQLWWGTNEVLVKLRSPQPEDMLAWYELAPGLIDACMQFLCSSTLNRYALAEHTLYIPVGVESITCYGPSDLPLWIHGHWHAGNSELHERYPTLEGEVHLCDEQGRLVLLCHNLRLKAVNLHTLLPAAYSLPANWLYELSWQKQPLERVESSSLSVPARPAGWLLLAHSASIGQDLAIELGQRGVYSQFLELPTCTSLSSDEPAWLSTLQALLRSHAEEWAGIAYICQDPPAQAATETSAVMEQQLGICRDVLLLTQMLAQRAATSTPPRIWLITKGTQVFQQRRNVLEHATLWGLGPVIGLEHPDLWGGLIDLELADLDEHRTVVSLVADELLTPHQIELVALRQQQRYVARLHPLSAAAQGAPASFNPGERYLLRTEASYLITGGLGELGLLTARWMAERGARHLVLLGRNSPAPSALAAIQALRDSGAEVMVAQGDVTDETRMAELFAMLRASLPPLRGIIHAAGTLDDGILLHQNPQRLAHVFGSKVAGAWNLHKLSMEMLLDFFVLYSSTVSLIGSPGQGNYAAANAFLDALAHHRHAQGLPALSINWGAWEGSGLGSTRRIQQEGAFQGMDLIPSWQGMLILEALLQRRTAQVGVLPIKWPVFSRYATSTRLSLFSELQAGAEEAQPVEDYLLARRLLDTPARERHALLTTTLRAFILQVLGARADTTLDPRRPLRELGFDSLMSVELRNLLRAATGYPFPATLVYDYPTMTALIDHLLSVIIPQEAPSTSVRARASTAADTYTQEELAVALTQLSDEELQATMELFGDQQNN
ncbi:MAG TPA: type I polyketide synthase [Ktedonobacteraceae bacterium]